MVIFPQKQTHPFSCQYLPVLLDWSNETSRVFPGLKSTSHFLPQSSLVDQYQVQKPILVVATDQMPDHI